jgi:ATP-dependent Clp protease adaptor protein ClpS
MSDVDRNNDDGSSTGVVVQTRTKTKKPSMYKVLMLNDDYTPMEFVVLVLEKFFSKSREEATQIMLHVHRRGVGICGVFTYEVAETKVTQPIWCQYRSPGAGHRPRPALFDQVYERGEYPATCYPVTSSRACIARWPKPISGATNTRRSSISCWP